MTANEAVPLLVDDYLNPGHIHLHQRGTTPLASLEQNHTHGLACSALLLHCRKQATLWRVEHKLDVACRALVLDRGTRGCPELKVIPNPQAVLLEHGQRVPVGVVTHHRRWQPQFATMHTLALTPLACERIVGCRQRLVAAAVFVYYVFH